MPHVFENLKTLKTDMEAKGWIIDSFLFQYKRIQYIVLVKLYTENERRPQYALLKLEFIRQDNLDSRLLIPVNVNGFLTDIVPIGDIKAFFWCRISCKFWSVYRAVLRTFSGFYSY